MPIDRHLSASWRRRLVAAVLFGLLFTAPVGRASAQQDAGEVLSDQPPPPPLAEEMVSGHSLITFNKTFTEDLDAMRARKRIRILVPFSKSFYFIDKGGAQAGLSYEMGKEFESWLNKKDKAKATEPTRVVFIAVPRDKLISGLGDGDGDIAIGNITVTEMRSQQVDFGHPLMTNVREILVTGPIAPAVTSLDDLGGKEILLRPSSSYFEHLTAMNQERSAAGKAPFKLSALDEDLEDEDIMEMVNVGMLPWAVVDEHKAKLWETVYTKMKLHSDIAIHEGGEIAWAIRKNSPLLKDAVDDFADTHKIGTLFGNMIKKRYLTNKLPIKRATSKKELVKFEKLIPIFREYGKYYRFDALMIAAQGYQESKLNQEARSHRGAVGVMQLLPSTAADRAIGVEGIDKDAVKNVEAGVKYLRLLTDKYLNDPALDDKNRTLMAFAAYNAGPGNLRKFRKLAQEAGLNPNVWFGNVENAAADIVGRETVDYVSNIYIYYIAYRLSNEREENREKAKEAVPAGTSTTQ